MPKSLFACAVRATTGTKSCGQSRRPRLQFGPARRGIGMPTRSGRRPWRLVCPETIWLSTSTGRTIDCARLKDAIATSPNGYRLATRCPGLDAGAKSVATVDRVPPSSHVTTITGDSELAAWHEPVARSHRGGDDVRESRGVQIVVLGLATAGCGGSSGPPPLTD